MDDPLYTTALSLIRSLKPTLDALHAKDPDLGRQARRAASSVVLNIAEANGSRGGNVRLRFGTACGSVKELRAALEVAEALGYVGAIERELVREMDRVAARTYGLSRK